MHVEGRVLVVTTSDSERVGQALELFVDYMKAAEDLGFDESRNRSVADPMAERCLG
jgi:hypothetical protein